MTLIFVVWTDVSFLSCVLYLLADLQIYLKFLRVQATLLNDSNDSSSERYNDTHEAGSKSAQNHQVRPSDMEEHPMNEQMNPKTNVQVRQTGRRYVATAKARSGHRHRRRTSLLKTPCTSRQIFQLELFSMFTHIFIDRLSSVCPVINALH